MYTRTAMMIATLLTVLLSAGSPSIGQEGSKRPLRILMSTDVATGLIDTHGGQAASPVSFSSTWGSRRWRR